MRKVFLNLLLVFLLAAITHGQSGGGFTVTQSVTAAGGGNSSGGGFSIVGTAGQHSTDYSTAPDFTLRAGFWVPEFAPTAANVAIGGRISTPDGAGIRNVVITLTDLSNGSSVSTLSTTFGYYRIDAVPIGRTYLLSVTSKQFVFEPGSRIIAVLDDALDEDFTGTRK